MIYIFFALSFFTVFSYGMESQKTSCPFNCNVTAEFSSMRSHIEEKHFYNLQKVVEQTLGLFYATILEDGICYEIRDAHKSKFALLSPVWWNTKTKCYSLSVPHIESKFCCSFCQPYSKKFVSEKGLKNHICQMHQNKLTQLSENTVLKKINQKNATLYVLNIQDPLFNNIEHKELFSRLFYDKTLQILSFSPL